MISALSSLLWGSEEETHTLPLDMEAHCIPGEIPGNDNEWIYVGSMDDLKSESEERLHSDTEEEESSSSSSVEVDSEMECVPTASESDSSSHVMITRANSYTPVAGRMRKLEVESKNFRQQRRQQKDAQPKILKRSNKVHVRQQGARASKRLGRMNGKHTALVGKRAS